jgi:hypothetical protein
MALGGMLAAQRDKFPQAYAKWEAVNSNVTGLFELINKVSTLRRTANSPRARTHSRERWLSHTVLAVRVSALRVEWTVHGPDRPSLVLLHAPVPGPALKALPRARLHLAHGTALCFFFCLLRFPSFLPPLCDLTLGDGSATQDLVGDNKTSGVVGMPFHLNNVDMTVISNFLYGTSQVVLEEINGGAAKQYFISHPDFQQVYENSAQAIRSGAPPHHRTRSAAHARTHACNTTGHDTHTCIQLNAAVSGIQLGD